MTDLQSNNSTETMKETIKKEEKQSGNEKSKEPVEDELERLMKKCKNSDADAIMLCRAKAMDANEMMEFLDQQSDQSSVYIGTVKSFSAKTGYGFIVPNDKKEDIFVHESQISCTGAEPGVLEPKMVVEYMLSKNDWGKHVAIHVTAPGGAPLSRTKRDRYNTTREANENAIISRRRSASNELSTALVNSWFRRGKCIRPKDEKWQRSLQNLNQDDAELLEEVNKTFEGTVTWFKRGVGLIRMDPDEDGTVWIEYLLVTKKEDILSDIENPRLRTAQKVEFKLAIGQDLKLVAVDITGPNGAKITSFAHYGKGIEASDYKPIPMPEKGTQKGSILWFDPNKQYGFITPEDGGENCFVHMSEIRTVDYSHLTGEAVEYKLGRLDDGKLVALEVTGYGLLQTGVILWFDRKKRYGFVAPEAGGDNYFVHGSEIYTGFSREMPNLSGQPVEFRVGKLKDGKLVAVQVTGPHGSMLPLRGWGLEGYGPPPGWPMRRPSRGGRSGGSSRGGRGPRGRASRGHFCKVCGIIILNESVTEHSRSFTHEKLLAEQNKKNESRKRKTSSEDNDAKKAKPDEQITATHQPLVKEEEKKDG